MRTARIKSQGRAKQGLSLIEAQNGQNVHVGIGEGSQTGGFGRF